jgi:hypothetical protein
VGGTGTLSATGGGSNNPVTFTTTSSTSICTLSGANGNTVTVNGVGAGTCTITANQAGNGTYSAAPTVTQSITVASGGATGTGTTLNFVSGWNLVGNSVNTVMDVASTFGSVTNAPKVSTVWKWLPSGSATGVTYPTWGFYAPAMSSAALTTFAAGKGYEVLTSIKGGEGFWVNAKSSFSAQLPSGSSISSLTFIDGAPNNLPQGWSLIAIGDNLIPREFDRQVTMNPPAMGVIPLTLNTLWAWDSSLSKWYFYAPGLDAQGGTILSSFITSKGYLDFGNTKTLDPTMGFWVNHP